MIRFSYSETYRAGDMDYRHVTVDRGVGSKYPDDIQEKRILSENTWRDLGIQQSRGWEHYGYSACDVQPILLFKRHKNVNPLTGLLE